MPYMICSVLSNSAILLIYIWRLKDLPFNQIILLKLPSGGERRFWSHSPLCAAIPGEAPDVSCLAVPNTQLTNYSWWLWWWFAISVLLLVHRTLEGQERVRGLWTRQSFQPELDGACNQDWQKLCDETEDDCSGEKQSAKSLAPLGPEGLQEVLCKSCPLPEGEHLRDQDLVLSLLFSSLLRWSGTKWGADSSRGKSFNHSSGGWKDQIWGWWEGLKYLEDCHASVMRHAVFAITKWENYERQPSLVSF